MVDTINNRYLQPGQILNAFDEHWKLFEWRLRDAKDRMEVTAYRQLIEQLTHEVNSTKHLNAKLEHVFKTIGIDPREQKSWAEKIDG